MDKSNLPKNFFEELDWSTFMDLTNYQLSHRNYSYSNGNGSLQSKPTIAIAIDEKLSARKQDELVKWASDLIDPAYRLWFIKQLKRVGKQAFVDAANAARKYDGKSRQKVFAALLKD